MPELPEVETVRRTLKNFVLHKTIDSIEVRYPRIIDGDVETFVTTLIHQSICDIDRYGKYLIFILDHDAFISHLRMEGKYNINMIILSFIWQMAQIFVITIQESLAVCS